MATAIPALPVDKTVYTADDLLILSGDDTHRYELIQGTLYQMAPAGFEHGDLAMHLGSRMRVFADERQLGIVCAAETGFLLETNPDTVLAPDASFIRQERLPHARRPSAYFPGAPDLAVEVISPHDAASDVVQKAQLWLQHGVRLLWVVEPRTQTVMVYRRDGSAQLLNRADTLDGEDVLAGFTYPLDRLFA